jgi:hypothetical protein
MRKVVARHAAVKGVGTDHPRRPPPRQKSQPNDFYDPAPKATAGQQAGMSAARAANRAGRPPLA